MDNISIELYIIGYTFIGFIIVFLYSLPLRILGKTYKNIKSLFNNKWGSWGLF